MSILNFEAFMIT